MDSESEHQEDSVPTDPVEIAAVEEEPTATEEDLQPIDAPATTPPSVDTQTQASAIVEEDTPTIGEPEQQESPSQDQAPSALEDTVTAETAPSQAQQEVSIHSEPEAPAPPAHSDSFSKAPEETPSYRRGSDFSSVRESVVEDVRAPIAQHVGMSIAVSQIKKPATPKPMVQTIRSDLKTWYNKPYLGGFRQKVSMTEYFHAASQTTTPQEKQAAKNLLKFHRDSQTKFVKNRKTQDIRATSTQMTTSGCYVSTAKDMILRPRRYVTAEEYHATIRDRVIQIQCFVRQAFARVKVRRLIKERDERIQAIANKNTKRAEYADKKRQKEIESRLHPKTTKDFEILFNGLETWRTQETDQINSLGFTKEERLAALAELMNQEAILLQKIDRLKIAATQENKEKSIYRLLESMAAPKKWIACNQTKIVHVDTPNTIRARELRDLYHALNIPLLSVDERLQILLHVKYTVKEFDCNLTREMVDLIDREADLVSRGRNSSTMEGLRKRISNLFLQFIQTPEFNPESIAHQKFPDAGQSWKRDQAVYFCRGCTKYLSSTAFYLSTTMKHLGKCKACTMNENIAITRKDDTEYTQMFRTIKLQEEMKRQKTGVPEDPHYNAMALLQESDIRYLVDVIWNHQSVISATKEELIMTRWDPLMEISPWNCILLTQPEAATHDKQRSPLDLYSDEFQAKIAQKHLAARQHFTRLPAIERLIRKNYEEGPAGALMPRQSEEVAV